MKRVVLLLILTLIVTMPAMSQKHGPFEQIGTDGEGNSSCVPPYGYTWACQYSCNTDGGVCQCKENDDPTSICMKATTASGGCGCFDHSCDNCCSPTQCF